jgi:ribonuclease P protein component
VEGSSSNAEERKDAGGYQFDSGRFRLTKKDRILRASDYRRVLRSGARYRTTHFAIRILENPQGRQRLGITAGRKSGKACERNRIKRRLREYFRLNRDKMPPDMDMVFIALQGATRLETSQLREELDRFFEKGFSTREDTPSLE